MRHAARAASGGRTSPTRLQEPYGAARFVTVCGSCGGPGRTLSADCMGPHKENVGQRYMIRTADGEKKSSLLDYNSGVWAERTVRGRKLCRKKGEHDGRDGKKCDGT